jgi:hypothetical protein
MMAPIEFEAADRARLALLASHRLSPREAYVLRAAPIRGLSQTKSRRLGGEVIDHRIGTMWLVRDENLTMVVDTLLARGFLALRVGAGALCRTDRRGPCGTGSGTDKSAPAGRRDQSDPARRRGRPADLRQRYRL